MCACVVVRVHMCIHVYQYAEGACTCKGMRHFISCMTWYSPSYSSPTNSCFALNGYGWLVGWLMVG